MIHEFSSTKARETEQKVSQIKRVTLNQNIMAKLVTGVDRAIVLFALPPLAV